MTAIEQPAVIDTDKLMGFVFRAVDEVGATLNTALVVMGDRLGLYRALAGAGPLSPAELAERTDTAERYVREWLNAQAAGAYIDYDPDSGRYALSAEHAIALTDESSPAYLPGFFQIALGAGLIGGERPSNRTDIAYLFYLPFAMVFASSDNLHRRLAPLFMRPDRPSLAAST